MSGRGSRLFLETSHLSNERGYLPSLLRMKVIETKETDNKEEGLCYMCRDWDDLAF